MSTTESTTEQRELSIDTIRFSAGYDEKKHNYAVSPPIYQTTSFDFGGVERANRLTSFKEVGNIYSRTGNPTVGILEEKLRILEGGSGAVACASGMSAISLSILNVAEGGGRILTTPYLYGGTKDSFKKVFPKFGIHFDYAKNILNPEKLGEEIKEDTKAIYLETISNPNGFLLDVDAISAVAHEHGIPVIIDNTVATPYIYKPLEHGADVVVYSATKGLNGQANGLAGIIIEGGTFDYNTDKFAHFREKYYTLRDRDTEEERSFLDVFPDAPFTFRTRFNYVSFFGASLSPYNAYMTLLGIETLTERLGKESKNALKIAQFLETHQGVEWVRYSGLESSPYYDLAKRDYPNGVGSLISFGFRGTNDQIETFIDALEIFHYHVNLGDTRSLITNSPKNTHGELTAEEKEIADIPLNLIRLSIGLENVDDLISDLNQAFVKALN
ncbi:MAG: aminotransferase class V-fold PLP-dependent enzyme [Clostridiales Family XIII bacterium]|jgi:O-acetylhomoserine (thiol)-lyase|nr:aminotransferase class V-fold PLP-dependent enzyme [Clostridiales Family XIII bacterium]